MNGLKVPALLGAAALVLSSCDERDATIVPSRVWDDRLYAALDACMARANVERGRWRRLGQTCHAREGEWWMVFHRAQDALAPHINYESCAMDGECVTYTKGLVFLSYSLAAGECRGWATEYASMLNSCRVGLEALPERQE